MDSVVAGFYGRRGAGKTLSMVTWAYSFLFSPLCVKCKHIFRQFDSSGDPLRKLTVGSPCPVKKDANDPPCGTTLINNHMLGWKCFANFHVSFAEAFHENIAEFISTFPDELAQSVLLVDETPAVANSRRSMSSLNLMISLFMEQLRKRKVHLFYTAQNPLRIDRSIYWQTDVAIDCKASPKGRSVELKLYDQWGAWKDNGATGPAEWPPERPPDAGVHITRAERFWDFYDTEEIVLPTEYFKRQREVQKQNGLISNEPYLDPESPEGIAADNEINKILEEISSVGVDRDILVRRMQRKKIPIGKLSSELKKRNFKVETLGKNKEKIFPPEPD